MQQASAVVRISPANGVKSPEGFADFKQTAVILSRPYFPKFLTRILKISGNEYLYEKIEEEKQVQFGIIKKIN